MVKPLSNKQHFENVLPQYLMVYAATMMQENGYIWREDIYEAMVTGFDKSLPSDPVARAYVMPKLESVTSSISAIMKTDHIPTVMVAIASWTLKLLDEGIFKDTQSTAAMSAIVVVEEAREEPEDWETRWQAVDDSVNALFSWCTLQGFYISGDVVNLST